MAEFRYLPDEHCFVGDDGTILSEDKVLLNQSLQTRKHLQVEVTVNGLRTKHLVHRLVAKAYLNLTEESVVSHLDGNFENCHVSNLHVNSRKEVAQHMVVKGTHVINRTTKLTNEQVNELLTVKPTGCKRKHYAEIYGVSLSTVHKILSGRTWRALVG